MHLFQSMIKSRANQSEMQRSEHIFNAVAATFGASSLVVVSCSLHLNSEFLTLDSGLQVVHHILIGSVPRAMISIFITVAEF